MLRWEDYVMIKQKEEMREKANSSVFGTQPRRLLPDLVKTGPCCRMPTAVLHVLVPVAPALAAWAGGAKALVSRAQAARSCCRKSSDTLEEIKQDF